MYTELICQDCSKEYKNVSKKLGNQLDKVLYRVEKFFYSKFWENRYKRRLKEEDMKFYDFEFDATLGVTSDLLDDTEFKSYNTNSRENGVSNKGTMIALNTNLDRHEYNDRHIESVVIHEFGHRQYNQKSFNIIRILNKRIIGNPEPKGLTDDRDIIYFTGDNEIRQRIIPIIMQMWEEKLSLEEAYERLEHDDLKEIYSKDYIIYLIKNLL